MRPRKTPGRSAPSRTWGLLVLVVGGLLTPVQALAHERWVKHDFKPFNRGYFQSMSGEVLRLSLLAAAAVAVIVGLWYLGGVVLLDRLTPTSVERKVETEKPRPARRPLASLTRFLLDGYVAGAWLGSAERIAVFVFARLPGLVLLLGAAKGWLVMPSFPVGGALALPLRIAEVVVALWILSGLFPVALGVAFVAIFTGLCAGYGLAAVDAIPVLASAFFYLFSRRGIALNERQMVGIRLGLGVGFFLLGLVNKIYDAELFIGVGDNYPHLVTGPQSVFPWLTRESWSFTTALGEMTFGLLLLLGVFSRLTSLALALIFGNFILVFGWPEIVHLYPMAGFVVLFIHASRGTALDDILFRTHVNAWRAMGYHTSYLLYRGSVFVVAIATGALLMFAPLYLAVEWAPRLFGH
jgi:uncharacterized membrane protein YphA (DoxX/SURF4 family)